jgi:hypothetical protein
LLFLSFFFLSFLASLGLRLADAAIGSTALLVYTRAKRLSNPLRWGANRLRVGSETVFRIAFSRTLHYLSMGLILRGFVRRFRVGGGPKD